MRRLILIISSILLSHQVLGQPVVATSIKPLHLIAVAITADVSDVTLVLEGNEDPHHPSLRPSQRRTMSDADIFIWIGPALETGLERVVSGLNAEVITAMNLDGLHLMTIDDRPDPHLWLDTGNALVLATRLAEILVEKDPDNGLQYKKNLSEFTADLQMTEAAIREYQNRNPMPGFVVYHNGYQYFEHQFGLTHSASFTSNEEIAPGIRQILGIKTIMLEEAIHCVIVNPSVNTRNLDNQLEQAEPFFVVIDVLGRDIPYGRRGYQELMETVEQGFASCQ